MVARQQPPRIHHLVEIVLRKRADFLAVPANVHHHRAPMLGNGESTGKSLFPLEDEETSPRHAGHRKRVVNVLDDSVFPYFDENIDHRAKLRVLSRYEK